jgi:hypothetical protein
MYGNEDSPIKSFPRGTIEFSGNNSSSGDYRRADTLLETYHREKKQTDQKVVEYNPRYPENVRCPFWREDDSCGVAKEKGFYFWCEGFWFYGCTVYLLKSAGKEVK